MEIEIILGRLSLAAYFVSTLFYIGSLLIQRVHPARTATGIFAFAFTAHTMTIIALWMKTGHGPILTIHDVFSFFSWVVGGTYLIFQLRTKTRVLGALVAPVSFILLTMASAGLGGPVIIPEILKSGLVSVHAMLSVIGEALFAVASLSGLMYLLQDNRIKHKKARKFIHYLPSLHDLDRINHTCLLWGFPLMTLGILSGFIWSWVVWGSLWQWDSKLMWASGAWIVYALLLHQRLAIGWKGHKAALFSVVAFVLLGCAFAVEKAFFTTIHRFF